MTSMNDWAGLPMQQLVCGCMTETFQVIIGPGAVRVICSHCKTVNGEYPLPERTTISYLDAPGATQQPLLGTSGHLGTATPAPEPHGRLADNPSLPQIPEVTPGTPGAGQLAGGPYDGTLTAIPADVTTYWVGDIKAGWATEMDVPPATIVNEDLHAYRYTSTRGDGVRVFTWIAPQQ